MIKKISDNVLLSLTYALIGVLAVGGYLYYKLTNEKIQLELRLSEKSAELSVAIENINNLNNVNNGLTKNLDEERGKVNTLTDSVNDIGNTVGTLTKLASIDKELLQKYSKVYFLNENYIPKHLTDVPQQYLVNKEKITTMAREVSPFFEKMIQAGSRDGVDLRVISAYRSFDEQISLKSAYKVLYGAGTSNQFSADQGYSEHQLGTTFDLTTVKLGATFSNFESDPGYKWLESNAYKYGFVLSYPKNNKYYIFEPWHWRFVGIELATYLHRNGKGFYDLEQRDLNRYLVNIFES